MGFFNAFVNLPIPKGKVNRFPLDSDTCTTSDYLRYKVVFSRLYSPNCKWKIDASQFTRLTPLDKPAFANATFENRLFFVPYRTIVPDFTHLVDGTQNNLGVVPSSVHTVTFASLMLALIASISSESDNPYIQRFQNNDSSKSVILSGGYDLALPLYDASDNTVYVFFYQLTSKGKQVLDILLSLGYNFPFYFKPAQIGLASSSQLVWKTIQIGENSSKVGVSTFCCTPSASFVGISQMYEIKPTSLALASALKIYYDYYLSGRGSRTAVGVYIEGAITSLVGSDFDGLPGLSDTWVNCSTLRSIYKFLTTLYYDDDYFNTASPTYMDTFGTYQQIAIDDASYTASAHSKVVSDSTSVFDGSVTPRIVDTNGSNTAPRNITQFLIDSLLATTKYMRRNNIVGWRSLDRYLAHYGVKLEPAVLNRSLYLGKFICDIGIDAIYQQSATEQDVLGAYAGIGLGGGKGHFEFESKEFGQLIMISVCKPRIKYYQGLKREMLDKARFEFFNGSYDNLGMQGIARCEVCNSNPYTFNVGQRTAGHITSTQLLPSSPAALWGFQNRYAHLKQSTNQDLLTGDFRFNRAGATSYDYMHQFRSVGEGYNISSTYVIDDNFRDCRDREQYDRIFTNTSSLYDHFICYFNFKVNMYAPWFKLFDSLDFEEELHNGQPTVNVQVGGTKF